MMQEMALTAFENVTMRELVVSASGEVDVVLEGICVVEIVKSLEMASRLLDNSSLLCELTSAKQPSSTSR